MSGVRADKGLLQGQARRMGGFTLPQTLNSPEGSSKAFLKARGGGIAAGEVMSLCTIL